MVKQIDDALLQEILIGEMEYNCKIRQRRAEGITIGESADIIAYYDNQIEQTERRIHEFMDMFKSKKNR